MRFVRSTTSALVSACVVAALVIVGVGLAADVAGAKSCERVVDETGQLDIGAVEEAALAVPGADARVVFFQSVPGADIEAAVDDVIAACYSDGPEGRQFDLVVIAVSLDDRLTRIAYGGEHVTELDPTQQAIQVDTINPQLASGDFTAAMVLGLEAIGDELQDDPDVAGSGTGADPSGSTPSADGGSGPLIAVAIVAGLLAIMGARIVIGRRRLLNDERNALEAASQQPLIDLGLARERVGQLRGRTDVWRRIVSGTTAERLAELSSTAARAVGELDGSIANYSRATHGGIGELDRQGVVAARGRLDEMIAATGRADAAMDRWQQFGDRIERLRMTMPVKRASIQEAIVESLALADAREADGWVVDSPRQVLNDTAASLEPLDLDDLAIDVLALEATIDQSEAAAFASHHELQTLPDRLAGLLEWAGQLTESHQAESERTDETERQLAELAADHAPESIARAGSIADVRSRLASSAQDRELGEQQIQSQAWDAASANLESAGRWLVSADELLDHMDVLTVSMDTARRQAPALLDDIDIEISELDEFIRRHDRDLPDSFDVQPARARALLDALRIELTKSRPNHLRVAESGSELVRQLDAILVQAQEEQARVAALRRAVARERQRAHREIERADKTIGWKLFENDDQRMLDHLRSRLGDDSEPLETQLATAARARTDAAAIRQKVIDQRRRNSGWVMVGGGGGWSSGGGGGGFGGFSGGGGGFGGFSGGGGGFGGGGGGSSW